MAAMENVKELYLEDETFDDARQNFNVVLQKLFRSMIESGSDEGDITLKIGVSLREETITNTDPDIGSDHRTIQIPSFVHKVTSTVSVKNEMKGNKNPNMELVWDEETSTYKLQYISNTEQRSIFDKDADWNNTESTDQESLETDPEKDYLNVPLLEGEVADEGALPGEVSDGYVDGEFREIDGEDEPETAEEQESEPVAEDESTVDSDYSYEEPRDPEDEETQEEA